MLIGKNDSMQKPLSLFRPLAISDDVCYRFVYLELSNRNRKWSLCRIPCMEHYKVLRLDVGPGLWVKADCTHKRHLFLSTKHPPLTPFIKPCDILYL